MGLTAELFSHFALENLRRVPVGWNMIRERSLKFFGTKESMLLTLYRDFRHNVLNIFMHFEQFNSGLQRYGSIVKTSMMKFAPEDFLSMTLTLKL
jgi:hypothetical protein